MTTSGTTAFALDIADILEEAHELAGLEMRTGYQFRSARRSLDLLLQEWANRGYNLWLIDQQSIANIPATPATVTLAADTVDIIEASITNVSGQALIDYRMRRMSYADYTHISNKQQIGRPTSYAIQRLVSGPVMWIWPLPDTTTYTLKYWRLRRIQDTGSATFTPDVPFRFVPALIAGLAHKLVAKSPEATPIRITFLKQEADQQFQLAAEEDREKSGMFVRPMRAYK